nr:right-handed parallel beta-helix repeat-containing protein [Candidatus Cloacimonadota bacterium]
MHKKLLVSWLFLLSGLFLFSYMNISGDMSGVTLTSGTYYVTGDLFVNAGTTFSLNPGVVIKFDPGYQLTVEGTLNAIGLSTPKIYFTSLDDNTIGQTISGSDGDPDPGDWDGIYFNGIGANEGICEMQYCQVKYGGSTTGTLLANISLEESDSGYFQDGVSRFSENFGILIYDCSPEISDSNIDNSGDAGIGIEDNCTSLISGNDLSGNSTNGILINDSLSYPEVSGNTIDFNGYYPIVC